MTPKDKEILKKIKDGFNKVHNKASIKRRSDWSREFFEVLKKIGQKERYKVYTHSSKKKVGPRKGGGEWLFDLSWSDEGTNKHDWKKKFKGMNNPEAELRGIALLK